MRENNKSRQFHNYVVCFDGFTMSIQGNHWERGCEPREDGLTDTGEYIESFSGFTHLEIQLKGGYEPLFDDYITKGCNNCGGKKQGYEEYKEPLYKVPIDLIVRVIRKHGGMIQGHMPKFDNNWLDRHFQNLKDKGQYYDDYYWIDNKPSFDPELIDEDDYKTADDLMKEEKLLGRTLEEEE